MPTEIEAKVAVDALEPIAERLTRLGAQPHGAARQRDAFFADAQSRLIDAGYGLRIRRQTGGGASKALLTLKGPKAPSRYKVRPETEVEIADPEAMESILDQLGYRRLLVIEKDRRSWHLDGCEVCLDRVARLGTFVEVEGPDEQTIQRVLVRLGLDGLEPIRAGYARLVREHLDRTNSGKHEAVFDDE